MLIELRKGTTIEPCTFTAIIGPSPVAIDLINTNSDLQRYLFLFRVRQLFPHPDARKPDFNKL